MMRSAFSKGWIARIGWLLGIWVQLLFPAVAQNLLTNGDFETGTVSGFSTALTLDNSGQIGSYSSYDLRTTASTAGTGWGPAADHTAGAGQYMFITRGANGNNTVTAVWSGSVSQTNGGRYTFSGWASVPTSLTAAQTPKFRLTIAGGGGFSATYNFSSPTTSWGAFWAGYNYTGTSGSVTYTLSVVNGSSGNNQANAISWDDLLLTAPEPSTYAAGVALAGVVGWNWHRSRRGRDCVIRQLQPVPEMATLR